MADTVSSPCSGYASWRTLSDDRTQVSCDGKVFIPAFDETTSKTFVERLKTAWTKYGDRISRALEGTGVPIPWFMGILCAESLGNPYACAPCGKENGCGLDNCQQCCAFGIMQIIDSTARAYSGVPGSALLGNEELSFRTAAKILADHMKRYGRNLPLIAGAYNAGSFRCRAGALNMFGNAENNGYTQRVITFANTAVNMGIGGSASSGSGSGKGSFDANTILGFALFGVAGYLLWKNYPDIKRALRG